jgi:hypothetical protein
MPTGNTRLTSKSAIQTAMAALPAHRVGLPAQDSVTAVTTTAGKYTIIHTNEMDVYEKGAMGPGLAAAPAPAAPVGDDFGGTDRKASKLAISAAPVENFKDVKDLISSLVPDAKMVAHKPKISIGAGSKRTKEEERNIHVTAFLYAASREADNDFHLIVGRDPKLTPEMYMTMELSGLPPDDSPALPQLTAARDAFKKFFKDKMGGKLPGTKYDFYDPPVSVQIDGSLFFDMTHASGSHPGPASLKSRMPVIWEVHPVTQIIMK